jgi:CheY-like chemotaxis protein
MRPFQGHEKMIVPEVISATTALKTNPNSLHVLLVEDNVSAMNVLKIMLKRYPVEVSAAMDAETAFTLVQSQPFDLMITDLGLPQKQGDEFAAMVRAYEKEKQCAPMTIVGLTGHALGEITQTCLDAGMNEVYRKPMDPTTLKHLIDTTATNKPKKNALQTKGAPAGGGLGTDLPDTEVELFQIDTHPLLDITIAIDYLDTEDAARDILQCLRTEGILEDLTLLKIAHDQGNWDRVEALAHKLKGGATFGTIRMYYALLYLERYRKAGHTNWQEELYVQMLRVTDETIQALDDWLGA